ncbi:MAG: hypothetical protein ACE5F8_08920, partial [Woeseiaceae bacterium]
MTPRHARIGRMSIVLCCATIVLTLACNEDKTAPCCVPEMVTIAGTLVNLETGLPAEGGRVWQLDTPYGDDIATGTDGAFQLQVPKGTVLYLASDDFDTQNDAWFPLINAEIPPVVANSDI